MYCLCMCAYLVYKSMEALLKIITILWGGGINLCNYFCTFAEEKTENIFVKI